MCGTMMRLLPLLTQMPLASVQNTTVGQAIKAEGYFRSCGENAIGDRMFCALHRKELEWLKSE